MKLKDDLPPATYDEAIKSQGEDLPPATYDEAIRQEEPPPNTYDEALKSSVVNISDFINNGHPLPPPPLPKDAAVDAVKSQVQAVLNPNIPFSINDALNARPWVEKNITGPAMRYVAPVGTELRNTDIMPEDQDVLGRTVMETVNSMIPMSPLEAAGYVVSPPATEAGIKGGLLALSKVAPKTALKMVSPIINLGDVDALFSQIKKSVEAKTGFNIPDATWAPLQDDMARAILKRKMGVSLKQVPLNEPIPAESVVPVQIEGPTSPAGGPIPSQVPVLEGPAPLTIPEVAPGAFPAGPVPVEPPTFDGMALAMRIKQAIGLNPVDALTPEKLQYAYEEGTLPQDLAEKIGLPVAVQQGELSRAKEAAAQRADIEKAAQADLEQQAVTAHADAVLGQVAADGEHAIAQQTRAQELLVPEEITGKPIADMSEDEFAALARQAMPEAGGDVIQESYDTAVADAQDMNLSDGRPVVGTPAELPVDHEFDHLGDEGLDPVVKMDYEAAQAEAPGLTEAQHRSMVKDAIDAYAIQPEDVQIKDLKDYALKKEADESNAAFAQAQNADQLATKGHATPILNMLWRRKLGRNALKGGDLDASALRGYFTDKGGMTVQQATENAYEMGWIPENDEGLFREALDAEIMKRDGLRVRAPDVEYRPASFVGNQEDLFDISGNVNPVAVPTNAPYETAQPIPKQKSVEAKGTEGISDVGDQLWYNKRNILARKMGWEDIKDLNPTLKIKEAVKTKIWPRPDYEELVAGGMNKLTAYAVKQVYDSISSKPDVYGSPKDEDIKRYIEEINRVKDIVWEWAKNPEAQKEFISTVATGAEKARTNPFSMHIYRGLIDKAYPVGPSGIRFEDKSQLSDVRAIGAKISGAMQISIDDMVKATKEIISGWPVPKESWERRFIIHKQDAGEKVYKNHQNVTLTEDEYFITGTGAKRHRILAGGFKSYDEAVTKAKELSATEKKKGVVEESLNINDVRRTGPQRRPAGLDVKPEDLMREFGFRGVNYGNWVKQGERQLFTNHAYDSLLDLAEILSVPAKALSLNGMVGIAFGAQGTGAYAAHFVPGVNEINLTKTMGAGSLAHEWAHALDHYFAVQAGEKYAKSAVPFTSDLLITESKLRPEIKELFSKIVEAMTRRKETQAEADAFLKSYNEKNLKGLSSWLSSLRGDLERTLQYDKKDPAKALSDFDLLANRIKSGDLGEGFENIGSNRDKMTQMMGSVHQSIGELRRLYKDFAGRVPSIDTIKAIDAWAGMLSSGLKKPVAVPSTVSSNFKRAAISLDQEKGGERYWSTNHEMFARAFQSYVLDKLAEKLNINDFLTRPQIDMTEMGATFPYPKDAERKDIVSAFNRLVSGIKTKTTDKGISLFSPGHVYQPGEMLATEGDSIPGGIEVAGHQAVADVKKVRSIGQAHDLRLDPAVRQINKRLMEKQFASVVGLKIETIQDSAEITAFTRHPFIEHFSLVKLKDGKIKGSLVLTSGKVGYVDPNEAKIQAFLATDCDEFYAAHGHPSGDSTPSAEDIASTKAMAADSRFKGHVVHNHKTYTAIMPDGTAIAQDYRGEKQSFRTDMAKMTTSPAVVGWVQSVALGDSLGIMFTDSQLQVMSFDQVDPRSDYNAYIKRHAKGYGSTGVFLVAGDAAHARMAPRRFSGNYHDYLVLSDDGTYRSAALGHLSGFKVSPFTSMGFQDPEGHFEALKVAETAADYNPDDYNKVTGRWKPGMALTLKSRLVSAVFRDGLPRGTAGTLVSVNPATGVMRVDFGGHIVRATPNMFKETWREPGAPQPGQKPLSLPTTLKGFDSILPEVKEALGGNYDVNTHESALAEARAIIAKDPIKALGLVYAAGDSVVATSVTQAVTSLMIIKLQNEDNIPEVIKICDHLAKVVKGSGQVVEFVKAIRQLGPDGIISYAKQKIGLALAAGKWGKLIEKLNALTLEQDRVDFCKKHGMPYLSVEKCTELRNTAIEIAKMPEGYDKNLSTAENLRKITEAIPKTLGDKIAAIQRLSQLLAAKTLDRNIIGNMMFTGLDNFNQVVFTVPIDKAMHIVFGTPRTQALPDWAAWKMGAKEGAVQGWKESMAGVDLSSMHNKYDLPDGFTFQNPFLRFCEKALNVGLRASDKINYTAQRYNVLSQLMKLEKLNGRVTKFPTPEMLQRAHDESLCITFNDPNTLRSVTTKLKKVLNLGRKWGLGNQVINYPGTPASLIMRSIEYSPFNLATTVKIFIDAGRGKGWDQERFSKNLSRMLTGGIFLIGSSFVLASVGLMTGRKKNKKAVAATLRVEGLKDYQTNITGMMRFLSSGFRPEAAVWQKGDTLYTYDWAQPMAPLIAMGANIAESTKSSEGFVETGVNALVSGVDTLMQQPLLQGIEQLFSNSKLIIAGQEVEGNAFLIGVLKTLKDVPASFMPQALNEVRQLVDNVSRNTNDPDLVVEFVYSVKNKVPWMSKSLVKNVDVLGQVRKVYQDEGNSVFNVIFNPGFVSKYHPTPTTKMVLDIWARSGYTIQIPRVAPLSITIKGMKRPLSNIEQREFQHTIGYLTARKFDQLASDPDFNAKSDKEKADYLEGYLKYVYDLAKYRDLGVRE